MEIYNWIEGAGLIGIIGGLARHESRLDGMTKLEDERDTKLDARLDRLEDKIDALRGLREWPTNYPQ